MKHLLIVSPHFPPINAPDHQRVRMMLPHLNEFGWKATVLAVDPRWIEAKEDPLLSKTVPEEVPVIRCRAYDPTKTRKFGLGNLAMRSRPFVCREGNRLLQTGKFDAVFYSTTQFEVMPLGKRWRRRFDVPYILDIQDPWRRPWKSLLSSHRPGGLIRYMLSTAFARWQEPGTVRNASGIVAVSQGYLDALRRRYGKKMPGNSLALPFAGNEQDFRFLAQHPVRQTVFDPDDGSIHWVYIGRGGSDMEFALQGFFQAFKEAEFYTEKHLIKMHFVGTSYAPEGRRTPTMSPIAREFGLEKIVDEITERLPYFEALQCLKDANALIVPGSTDPDYTASKIFPYILAEKPLLALFHRNSSVNTVLEEVGTGTPVPFNAEDSVESYAERIIASGWFDDGHQAKRALNGQRFTPWSAREMTRRLTGFFDSVVDREQR